jgi:hypothetical protein
LLHLPLLNAWRRKSPLPYLPPEEKKPKLLLASSDCG